VIRCATTWSARDRVFWSAALCLLLLATLAGCSAEGSSDNSSVVDERAPAPAEGEAVQGDGGPVAGDAGGDGAITGAAGGPSATVSGRRVITVDLEVETADVDQAAAAARGIATGEGGFVANESTIGGQEPSARITLRVPIERTDASVAALAALGDEVSRTSNTQDVEATLVDLESRIATAEASIARLRLLIDDATRLSDIIELESELSRREADLESIDAQRVALAGQAALSTITVTFTEPIADSGISGGFVEGLRGGWAAMQAVTQVLLIVVGALLPFLVVAAVVVLGIVALVRSRQRRRAGWDGSQSRVGPQPPPGPPAAPQPQPAAPHPTAGPPGNQS